MNTKKLSCLVLLTLMLVSALQVCSCTPAPGTSDNYAQETTDSSKSTDNISIFPMPAKYDYPASINSGGLERTYSVHISSSYDPSLPTPLVIVLDGGGGTGRGMVILTGFHALADKETFIVVY